MQIFIIFAFIILLLGIIFSLQNPTVETIKFLFWQFHGSLALVVIVSLVAGLVVSFLACLPIILRSQRTGRKLRKQVAEMGTSLAEQKQRLDEASPRRQSPSTSASRIDTSETKED